MNSDWIYNCLYKRIKGLSNSSVVVTLARKVNNIICGMAVGGELVHLHALVRMSDSKGSDVNLTSWGIAGEFRASHPVPVFCLELEACPKLFWA